MASNIDIVCTDHKEPALHLECRNGPNRGRWFYKCARTPDSDKCRFFKWEDQLTTGGNHPPRAGNNAFSSATPARNTSSVARNSAASPSANGRSGNIGRTGLPFVSGDHSLVRASQVAQASSSQESSSSTERTEVPSPSPSKRRRTEWGAAPTSPSSRQTNKSVAGSNRGQSPQKRPQTVEEAIDDDWDDDIADFDDFEAGGAGTAPSNGNGKDDDAETSRGISEDPAPPPKSKPRFTSFGGPTTPKMKSGDVFGGPSSEALPTTPPRALAPGLPVTPTSLAGAKSAGGVQGADNSPSTDMWTRIRNDPTSPFHARAAALMAADGAPQPTSPSLIGSGSTTDLVTPPRPAVRSTSQVDTPSGHLRTLSSMFASLYPTMESEFDAAIKAAVKTERQLEAAKQKANYHENRERTAQRELEEAKAKIRALQADNATLRTGMM